MCPSLEHSIHPCAGTYGWGKLPGPCGDPHCCALLRISSTLSEHAFPKLLSPETHFRSCCCFLGQAVWLLWVYQVLGVFAAVPGASEFMQGYGTSLEQTPAPERLGSSWQQTQQEWGRLCTYISYTSIYALYVSI